MTDGDKLLISINNKAFAVDANAVVAVVEVARIFMLPVIQSSSSFQKPGFIKGTITRRGEVVVVIDFGELFELTASQIVPRYQLLQPPLLVLLWFLLYILAFENMRKIVLRVA